MEKENRELQETIKNLEYRERELENNLQEKLLKVTRVEEEVNHLQNKIENVESIHKKEMDALKERVCMIKDTIIDLVFLWRSIDRPEHCQGDPNVSINLTLHHFRSALNFSNQISLTLNFSEFSYRSLYETFWEIWYYLYNLKIMKNIHGGVLLIVKLQASALICLTLHHTSHFHQCGRLSAQICISQRHGIIGVHSVNLLT